MSGVKGSDSPDIAGEGIVVAKGRQEENQSIKDIDQA